MILGGRYRLAEVTAEDAESRTFAAQESGSGRAVLVHRVLPPPPGSLRQSLQELAKQCPPGRGGIIEWFESEGTEYLVTEAREEFRDLRRALERLTSVSPPISASAGEDRFTRLGAWRVPASFSVPSSSRPGDEPSVSGIFGGPADASFQEISPASDPRGASPPQCTPTTADTAVPASAVDTPGPPPPAPADQGEFTRMFQAPVAPPAPVPPPVADQPGEFTRMFRAPEAPGSPAAPPRTTAASPGDFTQFFATPPPVKPAPLNVQPTRNEPSEFTRFFESPLGSGAASGNDAAFPSASPAMSPPPASEQPGEYTRLFQAPAQRTEPPVRESGATGAFATPTAFSSQPPASAEQVPSDFTRIIQARSPAPAEVPPPETAKAPAAQASARRRELPLGLVILFACLAVLAINLIMFFALRR